MPVSEIIKVRLEQMEVMPGHPDRNTARIIAAIGEARRAGIQLVVFPELAVPGYLIGDAWERPAFLRDCEECGRVIAAATDGVTAVFGNVAMDWTRRNEDGRVRKYNALFVARDKTFLGPDNSRQAFVIKTLSPNYREFDDSRYFHDARKLAFEEGCAVESLLNPVSAGGLRLGCILCEDAWDLDYAVSPLRILAAKGCDLFINISCSPYTVNKNNKRNRVYAEMAAKLKRPLVFVNNVGIQDNGKTVFTFDGESCVYDGAQGQVAGLKPFAEGFIDVAIPRSGGAFGQPVRLADDGIERVHDALAYGVGRFMDRCGVRRVVAGVSGGIDSAVVAALFARVLPPGDLLLVNMPSRFNSDLTRSLAREIAARLDRPFIEVPIEESVRLTVAQLDGLRAVAPGGGHAVTLTFSGAALENVQARDRGSRLLAAIAAGFGGVFTCNANKAEATVGYTTLYGDLGGFLAPLADLWKGEVYALGRHLNEQVYGREVIPAGCFDVVPSAELSLAQDVMQGRGDPLAYPYHDRLFRSWVEWWDRATPEENLEWYLDGSLARRLEYDGDLARLFPTPETFIDDLERWWNLYQGLGVAKRVQAPPVLAIKRRAFGFDHREAQIGAAYSARYLELKRRALGGGGLA